MITTIKHKELTWVDLNSPSAKEVDVLTKEYGIHPLIAEELTSLTMRPKVDVYKDSLYLILHFPLPEGFSSTSSGCEVDFVIGKDFLITARYDAFYPLEELIKNAQFSGHFREKYFHKHAGFLVFEILKELYNYSLRQLDQTSIKIGKVEKELFGGREKETVRKISYLKRDVLDFKRSLYQHEDVLFSFEQSGKDFFGKDFGHYLNFLSGEYSKIKSLVENNKEVLETLHQTNESLLSTKTNEVMKILTIMAFITFPLMLLSGVFGMNTVYTPILGMKWDFWVIVAIMFLATGSMFFFFKKKKWL